MKSSHDGSKRSTLEEPSLVMPLFMYNYPDGFPGIGRGYP